MPVHPENFVGGNIFEYFNAACIDKAWERFDHTMKTGNPSLGVYYVNPVESAPDLARIIIFVRSPLKICVKLLSVIPEMDVGNFWDMERFFDRLSQCDPDCHLPK